MIDAGESPATPLILVLAVAAAVIVLFGAFLALAVTFTDLFG